MYSFKELISAIYEGRLDASLKLLYAIDDAAGLAAARERAALTAKGLMEAYPRDASAPAALFSAPGRTELGGNHTDHQHGSVLCGAVNVDMLCCASQNGLDRIRITSRGYEAVDISLRELEVRREEMNSPAALVRGVAAAVKQGGYTLCGFDAYVVSDVPAGSGLSSSAAFEVLIGNIFNHFCCQGKLSPCDIARAGQYAENLYFGKPSGLMDQMASALGGITAISFEDPDEPAVKRIEYDITASGHVLCIVDTGSSHRDAQRDYGAVTGEMAAVAKELGGKVLGDVERDALYEALPGVRCRCGDRAALRAMHFFGEDRRAKEQAKALEEGEFGRFLALVNESGLSSALKLQNIWSPAEPSYQPVSVALAVGAELLEGSGAIRVHGGGFGGTIQAFVPNDRADAFKKGMEALLGKGACRMLKIRPVGGCMVAKEGPYAL